jgi:hopanoid biosynthesis associated protein HpnK
MKTYAIVNADDFGLAPGVNRGIIEAHCRGIVTSVSLMPTGDAFQEAIVLAHSHRNLSVGVHLTLVEGKSVLPAEQIPSLVTADGGFPKTPWGFLKRWSTGRIRLSEVYRELEAQVAKVAAYGIKIDKLDSHMHLHLLPGIFHTVVEVARKHQIKGIRLPREAFYWWRLGSLAGSAKQVVLRCLSVVQAQRVRDSGLFCPDALCGLAESGHMTEAALLRTLSSLQPGVTEIMVHPGYDDGGSEQWPLSRRYRREQELIAIAAPAVQELIRQLQIELVSYRTVHPKATAP